MRKSNTHELWGLSVFHPSMEVIQSQRSNGIPQILIVGHTLRISVNGITPHVIGHSLIEYYNGNLLTGFPNHNHLLSQTFALDKEAVDL